MGRTLRNCSEKRKILTLAELAKERATYRTLVETKYHKNPYAGEIGEGERCVLASGVKNECTELQCTVQRVQPDWGHHCGKRRQQL